MPGIDQDFRDYPGNARALKPNDPPYDASRKKYDSAYPNGDRPGLPPAALRFSSNFNDGTIYPLTIKNVDSVAVVDIHPFEGEKTMRGNLYTNPSNPLTDPYTGKPCNNNPVNLSIIGLTGGASRSWDRIFVRYWLRFDDADNLDVNGQPTNFKMGYFSDLLNDPTGLPITSTQSSLYPTMSVRGGCGVWSLYKNSGTAEPAPSWTVSLDTNGVNRGFAFDGNWNKVEILFDNLSKTFTIWINDIKVVVDAGKLLADVNGDFPVASTYTMDHISFFHADAEEWVNSVDRTGIRGAFHIARLQVWEGNPKPLGL